VILGRALLRLVGGLACALVIYLLVAIACVFIPVGGNIPQEDENVDVFVSSNGIHVGIAVPVSHPVADWRAWGVTALPHTRYLIFGWGQRDFYLETPSWADFDLATGIGAVLWRSDTLVHVEERDRPPADAVRLRLSEGQYRRLAAYLRGGFAPGPVRRVPGASYTPYDSFYEGTGTYSPFMTCNEWANRALAAAGVRAALWSPFPHGVMRQARLAAP